MEYLMSKTRIFSIFFLFFLLLSCAAILIKSPLHQTPERLLNVAIIFPQQDTPLSELDRVVVSRSTPQSKLGYEVKFAYPVDRSKVTNKTYITQLKFADIWDKIQIGSIYDYANITENINFSQLKKDLFDTISYEILTFPEYNIRRQDEETLQIKISQLTLQKFQQLINSNSQKIPYQIAQQLAEAPDNSATKQKQYLYYDTKYKIRENQFEQPLCIFSMGYNIYSKNRYKQYFDSITRQNYTNYHIVYVDDNSQISQIEHIVDYLQNGHPKLRSRIRIVHTLQHLGPVANMYYWIDKYCKEEDIVVMVDCDDALIGSQVFQVISSVYKEASIWFTYSKYLTPNMKNESDEKYRVGFSKPLKVSANSYRNYLQTWDVSHMKSFRKKLFERIPLEMLLEYHYNEQDKSAYPQFYDYATDTFQIFPLLELAGDEHYKHIPDYLYMYSGPIPNQELSSCYLYHEKVDDFKSRIKTPLMTLNTLSEKPNFVADYKGNPQTFQTFKWQTQNYRQCLQKYKNTV